MIQQTHRFRVAVLISGRGSNLESLIKNALHYEICAVISNNPEAKGLELASRSSIPSKGLNRADFSSLVAFKSAIFDYVADLKPDLVCLAGFMMVVPANVTEKLAGRIINIHPSLLPNFPGLDTHARVLSAKESYHGCTVHYVDSGIDTGPIIAQAKLAVNADESEANLSARVLSLEHRIYPWVVNLLALRKIKYCEGVVQYSNEAASLAANENFILPQPK